MRHSGLFLQYKYLDWKSLLGTIKWLLWEWVGDSGIWMRSISVCLLTFWRLSFCTSHGNLWSSSCSTFWKLADSKLALLRGHMDAWTAQTLSEILTFLFASSYLLAGREGRHQDPKDHHRLCSRTVIFQILACVQSTWDASHKCGFIELPSWVFWLSRCGWGRRTTFSVSTSVDCNTTGPSTLWKTLFLG